MNPHLFFAAIVAILVVSVILAALPDGGHVDVPIWVVPIVLLAVIIGYLYGKARAGSRA